MSTRPMTLDSDAYGVGRTHEPVLAAVLAIARPGPVLEMGAGYFSTPLLHAMCAAMNRELVTIEGSSEWAEKFVSLRTPRHTITSVRDWDDAIPMTERTWAVVFIDHAPADRRIVEIDRLGRLTEFMVVHDSECPLYGYEPSFARFAHRYDYMRLSPWTTVLSHVRALGVEL